YNFAFFCQAEDGIRYFHVTGVQTCALPISFVRQQGSDQIAIQFLQVLLNRWNKRRRSKEFLRQQRMMRTASAQKALYQCIVLQEIGRASCRERVKRSVLFVSSETKAV